MLRTGARADRRIVPPASKQLSGFSVHCFACAALLLRPRYDTSSLPAYSEADTTPTTVIETHRSARQIRYWVSPQSVQRKVWFIGHWLDLPRDERREAAAGHRCRQSTAGSRGAGSLHDGPSRGMARRSNTRWQQDFETRAPASPQRSFQGDRSKVCAQYSLFKATDKTPIDTMP